MSHLGTPGPPPYPYAPPSIPPPFVGFPAPGPGELFNGAAHPFDTIRPLYGATFVQSIRRFFVSYARFSGRASRSEFWWSFLLCGLLRVIPFLLLGVFAIVSESLPTSSVNASAERSLALAGGLVVLAVHLGLLLPQLAVAARRLHDGDFSALLLLLLLIPWIGVIIIGVFMLLEPKPSGRRFDRDPMPAPGTVWSPPLGPPGGWNGAASDARR